MFYVKSSQYGRGGVKQSRGIGSEGETILNGTARVDLTKKVAFHGAPGWRSR